MGEQDRRTKRVKISKLTKEEATERLEKLKQTEPELTSVYARHLLSHLEILG